MLERIRDAAVDFLKGRSEMPSAPSCAIRPLFNMSRTIATMNRAFPPELYESDAQARWKAIGRKLFGKVVRDVELFQTLNRKFVTQMVDQSNPASEPLVGFSKEQHPQACRSQ